MRPDPEHEDAMRLRLECLKIASTSHGHGIEPSPDEVVARADAYVAFVRDGAGSK